MDKIEQKVIDRFWSKVKKSEDPEGCWEWIAGRSSNGRAAFWYEKRTLIASRFSYSLVFDDIPQGFFICHHCDNPICVKPSHLFAGTPKDNAQDCLIKNRKNSPKGNKHTWSILDEKQVMYVLEQYYLRGMLEKEIARILKVSRGAIHGIVKGKNWKHIWGKYNFKPVNRNRKLSRESVAQIKKKYSSGEVTGYGLAKEFNVSAANIYYILRNKTWEQ